MMKIISFKLMGKMAHFRKFYSNSSALTYYIPPRTTIIGIIAGLLGYERDSYYEEFSREVCKVALKINQSGKKIIQKMNYLMITVPKNDLNGSAEHHSQTAVEYLLPDNIRTGNIEYQIWFQHSNEIIMEKLENKLNENYYKSEGISFALGSAFNLGWIENEGIFKGIERAETAVVDISSIISTNSIKQLSGDKLLNNYKIVKERIPLEFNRNREITSNGIGEFIFDLGGKNIPVEVTGYIEINNQQKITWLE